VDPLYAVSCHGIHQEDLCLVKQWRNFSGTFFVPVMVSPMMFTIMPAREIYLSGYFFFRNNLRAGFPTPVSAQETRVLRQPYWYA
jgi:hypothetical protein